MYTNILVPLDGSTIAEGVLPYARAFATALGTPVHLLQVMDPDTLIPSVAAQQGRSHNILTINREHNGDYLKEIAASPGQTRQLKFMKSAVNSAASSVLHWRLFTHANVGSNNLFIRPSFFALLFLLAHVMRIAGYQQPRFKVFEMNVTRGDDWVAPGKCLLRAPLAVKDNSNAVVCLRRNNDEESVHD